jgi:hypothetical protein
LSRPSSGQAEFLRPAVAATTGGANGTMLRLTACRAGKINKWLIIGRLNINRFK